uniref:Uncharacterized protein n=1 Tax=Hyaloperonospora arabidopsidis (strain Emoy2) TaxID=559515 RepID=M4BR43_HYAAE
MVRDGANELLPILKLTVLETCARWLDDQMKIYAFQKEYDIGQQASLQLPAQ